MEFLVVSSKKILLILMGVLIYHSYTEAIGVDSVPQVGIDGNNTIAAVWQHDPNNKMMTTVIMGAYSHSLQNVVTLTDETKFSARKPLLALASDPTTNIKGAAVWISLDINNGHNVIHTTTLQSPPTLGWKQTPTTLSLNDGSEMPNDDYKIAISTDGQKIIVLWTAFFPADGITRNRIAISNDAGSSWNIQ